MKTVIRQFLQIVVKKSIVVFIAAVFIALAGGCEKTPRLHIVGILCGSEAFLPIADGFKSRMTELGYVEGRNIEYRIQIASAGKESAKGHAQEFVREQVDLIFAFPTEMAMAAKAAAEGTAVPVVFANAGIEGSNLVKDVREPGGNITGVRYPGPEQTLKRFEILRELVPWAGRVYVAYERTSPGVISSLDALREQASAAGISLVELPATSVREIEADLARRSGSSDIGIDAILIAPNILSASAEAIQVVSGFAAKHRIPIAGSASFSVEKGALFNNSVIFFEEGQLAAGLVHKIFKGIPAGSIPVVTAESQLFINYRVAQELGIQVPEGLLRQAYKVIR